MNSSTMPVTYPVFVKKTVENTKEMTGLSYLITRIKEIFYAIYQAITSLIFRYWGAKTDYKGYHLEFDKNLTPFETKKYLPFACANAFIHTCHTDWVNKLGYRVLSPQKIDVDLDEGIERHEYCFFDPQTRLKAAVLKRRGEIFIVFGALKSWESELDQNDKISFLKHNLLGYRDVIANWFGFVPSLFHRADYFVKQFLTHSTFKGKKITLVGQCLGGAIASYVALKNKMPAVCTNTFPLGAGLQSEIDHNTLHEADQYITHVTVKGDGISDAQNWQRIDSIAYHLGVKTPGNFGQRYVMPSAYKTAQATHDFVLGSMMVHMGYETRDKPGDIPELQPLLA